jgi:hypothetical protein
MAPADIPANSDAPSETPGSQTPAPPGATPPPASGPVGGGTPPSPVDPNAGPCDAFSNAASGEVAVLDDLEDGDANVPFNESRGGTWFSFGDPSGSFSPSAARLPEAGGALDSDYAMHVAGTGFSEWGAGFGVMVGTCYDASVYSGVSFWARGSANAALRVAIASLGTQPTAYGGACTTACGDTHGTNVDVTEEWTQYSLLFDEIAQQGWGTPAEFDVTNIFSVSFGFGVPEDPLEFDLWIDQIEFLP